MDGERPAGVVRKRRRFSLRRRAGSIAHALAGLRHMLVHEHNAWIHLAATVAALGAAAVLGLTRLEWALIVLAIAAVWIAEAVNTAFERLCDVASPAFHPIVEQAKDVAAGAVLIGAIAAALVGALLFGPRLLAVLGG